MEIPLIVESLEVADGVDRPRVGASYVKSSLLRSTLAGRDFGKGEFPFRLNFDNSSYTWRRSHQGLLFGWRAMCSVR
jgi:hypothetical protein